MAVPSTSSPAVLTVGITGHRDLESSECQRLRTEISRILTNLVDAAPETSIVFLSGLAEGADLVATDVALTIPALQVVAALPMKVEDYRRDFSGEAVSAFEDVLARCSDVIEVLPEQGAFDADTREHRDLLYQNHGRWLARNCHVLIAAWDGTPPEFVGGTADNIYFKAEGLSPLPSLLLDQDESPPDPGLVLWCPVRRSGRSTELNSDQIQVVGADGLIEPWTGDPGSAVRALDAFNRQADREACGDGDRTRRLFEAADGLATAIQGRYRRTLTLIMASGVLALASIDALQTTGNSAFALALALFLTLSISLWVWLNRSGLRDRFQQARALAEGARIQTVWLASGLTTGTADFFLGGQGAGVEWIRTCLRATWLMDRHGSDRIPDFRIAREWLDEQILYFQGQDGRSGAIRRTWLRDRALRRRAVVVLVAAAAALTLDVAVIVTGGTLATWVTQALGLTWSVGLGVGVALLSYGELMGYGQLSQRYGLTVPYLKQGRDGLRQAEANGSVRAAQSAIRTAGVEALREAGDWLALHSQRQVRPVG